MPRGLVASTRRWQARAGGKHARVASTRGWQARAGGKHARVASTRGWQARAGGLVGPAAYPVRRESSSRMSICSSPNASSVSCQACSPTAERRPKSGA